MRDDQPDPGEDSPTTPLVELLGVTSVVKVGIYIRGSSANEALSNMPEDKYNASILTSLMLELRSRKSSPDYFNKVDKFLDAYESIQAELETAQATVLHFASGDLDSSKVAREKVERLEQELQLANGQLANWVETFDSFLPRDAKNDYLKAQQRLFGLEKELQLAKDRAAKAQDSILADEIVDLKAEITRLKSEALRWEKPAARWRKMRKEIARRLADSEKSEGDYHAGKVVAFSQALESIDRAASADIPDTDEVTRPDKAVELCERAKGHSGPCNGFPRKDCPQPTPTVERSESAAEQCVGHDFTWRADSHACSICGREREMFEQPTPTVGSVESDKGWPRSEDCNYGRHKACDRDYCQCWCHPSAGLTATTVEPMTGGLAAAAPELLAACRVVVVFLDRLEELPDDDPLRELRRKVHATLRAALESAIKKAEGK